MEQKTDLRVIKTHRALTEAFWQMLAEKKFEDITVNELCERAMVRRATFYKHFADKYEFFAFIVRSKQAEFDAEIRQELDDTRPRSFYLGIIRRALDFLNSNEKLVQTVLGSNTLPDVLDILSTQTTIDITQKLKEDGQNGVPLPASPQVMAHFFTGALVYTLRWWITQKNVAEAELMEEIARLLSAFWS